MNIFLYSCGKSDTATSQTIIQQDETKTTYISKPVLMTYQQEVSSDFDSSVTLLTTTTNGVFTFTKDDNNWTYNPDNSFTGKDEAYFQFDNSSDTFLKQFFFVVAPLTATPGIPDDTFYSLPTNEDNASKWWALRHINAFEVWNEGFTNCNTSSWGTADKPLRIGILDSGVDLDHPDLVNNLNTTLDKDFVNDDDNADDDYGHGTHVAGIIAAQGNNSTGIAGVCWDAEIVAIKVLDDAGEGSLSDIIKGIDYANQNDIQITNHSYGIAITKSPDQWETYLFNEDQSMYPLSTSIQNSADKGFLMFAASGNSGENNDELLMIPANYSKFISNMISVGAVDPSNNLAYFSNYGTETVDIVAPGLEIMGTYIKKEDGDTDWTPIYSAQTGTSMSTPILAGAAAMLWSIKPDATAEQIRNALLTSGAANNYTGSDKIKSTTQLDLKAAVDAINSI
ncbi:MAG: S8 family serine peptidase [Bacteriovoracia bacterium]